LSSGLMSAYTLSSGASFIVLDFLTGVVVAVVGLLAVSFVGVLDLKDVTLFEGENASPFKAVLGLLTLEERMGEYDYLVTSGFPYSWSCSSESSISFSSRVMSLIWEIFGVFFCF